MFQHEDEEAVKQRAHPRYNLKKFPRSCYTICLLITLAIAELCGYASLHGMLGNIFIQDQNSKDYKGFYSKSRLKMVTADMLELAISSLHGVVGAWNLLSLSAARAERRKEKVGGTWCRGSRGSRRIGVPGMEGLLSEQFELD